MKIEDVKKLEPIERFKYWIMEREDIRLKKEAGEARPWTDDTILDTFRFCNVRRMDDKVSKWLMGNWYEPYFNHPNMLGACALARFINLPSSLNLITKQVFCKASLPKFDAIKDILRSHRNAGNTIFNGAYVVRGNDGEDKIASVVDFYAGSLDCFYQGTHVGYSLEDTGSMEHTWGEIIGGGYGFGSFMAGQVVADLRWAVEGEWKDRNSWAPIGPGSKKGMNLLHRREIDTPLSQEKFLKELIEARDVTSKTLPKSITERLELHDWQNCFCEFFKMDKCLAGGRSKQLYKEAK